MRHVILACLLGLAACTGGAAGSPSDDLGDLIVLSHSPGNGVELDLGDSLDGFNPLNNPTLVNPGAVTIVFSTTLDPTSVLNADPSDPQGTRNLRLFRFDTSQGPFDPALPVAPGVNPPGANVVVPATTVISSTHVSGDTVILRPEGALPGRPLPEGQYSVIVPEGVRAADGQGLRGREYFFFFRVGPDDLGPVILESSPAPGETGVDPTAEIRITLSETILASTVNSSTIKVSFQPAGSASPTYVPGFWYEDGGNAPGNNFTAVQLDAAGRPGLSGVSPRNGADLVFRPDLDALPTNMRIEDLLDTTCTQVGFPPRLGNRGLPLGQAITVTFETQGTGVTDTAGNEIPAGSPNTSFTFITKPAPPPIYAPGARSAVYFGDTVGVGVIDADPTYWPYVSGPNPPRERNSVVTVGTGAAQKVVRVPVPDLVDIKVDTRPYSAFYTPTCEGGDPSLYFPMVYALSRSASGGEVVVIDSSRMVAVGRFATPSPGGICLTARLGNGYLVVTNASANTATVYEIGRVSWVDLKNGLLQTQAGVLTQGGALLLDEQDFVKLFPSQRPGGAAPPGPPILGTVVTGVSPAECDITELPGAWGPFAPFSNSPILGVLNAGAATVDFTELVNLDPSRGLLPMRPGVNLPAPGTDLEWTPVVQLFGTGRYFCFVSTLGGTLDLFITGGGTSGQPSVRADSSRNFAPNALVNSLTGLSLPTSLQYAPNGTGIYAGSFTTSVLVTEAGQNRVTQASVTQQYPGNVMEIIGSYSAGPGPIDVTGAPRGVYVSYASGFFNYYVANAGNGTVREGSYVQAVLGTDIQVPAVLVVSTWWSQ